MSAPERPRVPDRPAGRTVLVRLAVVPLAVAATALLPVVNGPVLVFAFAGLVIAVLAPASVGALPLLAVELIAWIVGSQAGGAASWRGLVFAVALYLIHAAAALAANVPWQARVATAVLRVWAVRCCPALAAAIVLAAIVALVPGADESVAVDVIAFGAITGIGAALGWLAVHSDGRRS